MLKSAERAVGLIPVWTRAEKVWLELSPDAIKRTYFISPRLETGIGEAGLFGGLMASRWAEFGRPQMIEFRRVNDQIQIVALNANFRADENLPAAHAVRAAYSASLLASAPLASAAAADGKLLVDARALFQNDLLGLAIRLNHLFGQPYAYDARNSLLKVRGSEHGLMLSNAGHYLANSLAVPAAGAATRPSFPRTVPDARSLFLTVAYEIFALPADPMPVRRADPRIGYFTTSVADFSDDLDRQPHKHFINRWRLQKQEPAAPLSEPVEPIVFQIDRSVPEPYRQAITEGVLEWNKAFERIGLRNALRVEQAPADERSAIGAPPRASIRWMTNRSPRFGAIGPTHVDPRSGEILRAHIALESLSSRSIRFLRWGILASPDAGAEPTSESAMSQNGCMHGTQAAEQLGLALNRLLVEGGPQKPLTPDSPPVQRFVLDYLKDTTMHEVGHALGLRHNFKASKLYTQAELSDPIATAARGISASVMDYHAINLPGPDEPEPAAFQTTLGPYDYWAIEYGYRTLSTAEEAAALSDIAARSSEPAWQQALAFGTDEDQAQGWDPDALQFDLGRDAIGFARRRIALSSRLLDKLGQTQPAPDDPTLPRRTAGYVLRDLGRTANVLLRQIGGVRVRRDAPGSTRDALDPLPIAEQRQAFDLLLQTYLTPTALALPASTLRRLGPDFLDPADPLRDPSAAPHATEAPPLAWSQAVLQLQRSVLQQLLGDLQLARLADHAELHDEAAGALSLRTVLSRLNESIWNQAGSRLPNGPMRRNLQREHLSRLASLLLRTGPTGRADARAEIRASAQGLLDRVTRLLRRPGLPIDERRHLADAANSLQRTLDATLIRQAP